MNKNPVIELRKLSQQYAYSSLQLHEGIARKAGFSGTDHKYLSFFLQTAKLTAGELAELSGLSTGAVTGLIDRFEKKKLIKRKWDKNDRRKVFIVADQEKIKALLEPFYKEFQKETEELISSFSKDEIEIIQSYFQKAISLMKDTKNCVSK